MGRGGKAYVSSWTKNPFENIATGGMVAAYKGAAAGAGVNAPTSSSLGMPELLPGAKKVKGFEMPQNLQEAEMQMIQRQAAIASGQTQSVGQMQMNQSVDQNARMAMAIAASQRGASNPALAFRQAQLGNQQMGLEAGQQSAIMASEEKRIAEQMIAAQAASQRGVALQQSLANQNAQINQRGQNMQLIAGLGGTAAKVAGGAA